MENRFETEILELLHEITERAPNLALSLERNKIEFEDISRRRKETSNRIIF